MQPRPAPDPTRLPGALQQALAASADRLQALEALATNDNGADGDIYLSKHSYQVAQPALKEALEAWQDPEQAPGAAWQAWQAN